MVNNEVLAQYIKMYNQLKNCYLKKFGKVITLCILKKEGD